MRNTESEPRKNSPAFSLQEYLTTTRPTTIIKDLTKSPSPTIDPLKQINATAKSKDLALTRNFRATVSNQTYAAKGNLHINVEQPTGINEVRTFTYGFSDLQVWVPSTQSWIQLPDKFYASSTYKESAKREFYDRWRIYIFKRFKQRYIKIEILNLSPLFSWR